MRASFDPILTTQFTKNSMRDFGLKQQKLHVQTDAYFFYEKRLKTLL